MANSTDEIILTGNATQVLAEFLKVNKAILEQAAATKQAGKEASDADKQEQQWARNAKRDAAEMLGPRQRYNAEVAKLDVLLSKNKITQDEYNRALAKQQQVLQQTQPQVDGLSGKILGFGKEALVTFTGVGTAIAGVLAFANVLKAEYEGMRRRQQEAKDSQLSFGQAIRAMAINFAGDESLGREQLEQRVLDAAERTGATPEATAQAAGVAFSARGHLSAETAMQAVEAGLRLNPNDPTSAATLAGRSLDVIKKGIGIDDPRAAAMLLVQLQQSARVTDIQRLGKEFTPAIGSAMLRGDTIEAASERLVQLNNLMDDQEGSQSSTAFISMANRLAKFVPQTAGKDKRGKFSVPREAVAAFEAAGSTDARIDVMNQFPELQRAFFATNTFEAAAQAPIEEILAGSDRAKFALGKSRAGIGAPSVAGFEDFIAGIEGLDSQKLVGQANRAANNVKKRELALAAEGGAGQAQDIFDKALGKVDWSGPDFVTTSSARRDAANQIMWGADSAAAFASTLESAYMGAGGQSTVSAEDTNYLKQQIELLREIARSNKEMSRQPAAPAVPPENALGRQ